MPVVVCHCVGKPLRVKAAAGMGLPMQRLDSLRLAWSVLNRAVGETLPGHTPPFAWNIESGYRISPP